MLTAVPKTSVLVVEDDAALRTLYWASLTAAGYRVFAFEDGLDALRYLDGNGPPDAVVLDLELPRVSGRDVHQELAAHSETAGIPVVVVTGSDNIADLDPKRFACILRKPIHVDALLRAIENCLKRSDAAHFN